MNTAELVDGLRNQDPLAAQRLHECLVPSIWRFVFFRVNQDTHLAEDIVAETVLALVSAAAAGNSIENPGAWLRAVAQRRIHDHFRAAARVQHLVQQVQQQTDSVDRQDPVAKHDQKLQRESVRQAMDELSETYRLVLEWKYVDRLSVRVIAERLETTEKSVESILFRARGALRKQLQTEHAEPPATGTTAASERCGSGGAVASTRQQPHQAPPAETNSAPQSRHISGDSNESSIQERPSMFAATRFARQR